MTFIQYWYISICLHLVFFLCKYCKIHVTHFTFGLTSYFTWLFWITVQKSTSQCMITFNFSQDEICQGTNTTINVVQKCPENDKTLQMRINERKCYQCAKCDDEVLVYHCTRFLNNLIEVCSPNGLITG